MSRAPSPKRAERLLQSSVAVCESLEELRRDHKRAERRMIRSRRRLWLQAFEAPGSTVDRKRIAEACSVSINLVDAELSEARAEREARQ